MKKCDLHTHSVFCDGRDTPEEMVLSAIEKGLDTIGICCHSYVPFDEEFCIAKERYGEFQAEIKRLKEKYRDKIEVLCGIEQDYYTELGTEGFDYVIGSVHYFEFDGEYFAVDNTVEEMVRGCEKYLGGDYCRMYEKYYELVANVAEKTHCDIIGHFDLVTKFNRDGRFFDESSERYMSASKNAVDALLPCGKSFEINTGAVSRGYRNAPYPAKPIMDYIRENGGKFILSSDGHNKDAIAALFDDWKYCI